MTERRRVHKNAESWIRVLLMIWSAVAERKSVDARECQAGLILILAALVCVTYGADVLGSQEDHLGDAFIGVNLGWKRRGIADFDGDLAAPLWLKRRDIHNDAAAGVGALTNADGKDVARNINGLNRLGKGERIWRDHNVVAAGFSGVDGDEEVVRKVLRVHDGGAAAGGVGEDFELCSHANVVAVARDAKGHCAGALRVVSEGDDPHGITDLRVTKNAHRPTPWLGPSWSVKSFTSTTAHDTRNTGAHTT